MVMETEYPSARQTIGEVIDQKVNLQEILNLILEKATSTLGVKGSSLFVLEKDGKQLKSTASYGLKGPVRAERNVCETLRREAISIETASADPIIQFLKKVNEEGIASILSIPVLSNDKVIGIFRVHAAEGYEFSKEAITFIKEVADQVALAIQNVYLYEDAEERHEILMADVWKWFRSDSDPFDPRFRAVETLPTMTWQD